MRPQAKESAVTDVARRIAEKKRATARERAASDAERLSQAAARFAADLRTGAPVGEAWQIAQAAIDLLQQVARLQGMGEIGELLPEEQDKSAHVELQPAPAPSKAGARRPR
jgi:hypothetical protein